MIIRYEVSHVVSTKCTEAEAYSVFRARLLEIAEPRFFEKKREMSLSKKQAFRICVLSPPEFDALSCALFNHWCGGLSSSQALSLGSMKSFWLSLDEGHPLEFPTLQYREASNQPVGSANGNTAVLNLSTANSYSSNERLLLASCRVRDDYMVFQNLEHYLQQPLLFAKQAELLQVPSTKLSLFIEEYWSLDEAVATEMLGNRRLTSRSRKDLDEMSLTTRVPLRSVSRQFHNVKRIYAAMEDEEEEDFNLFGFVSTNYLLSHNLSRKYACIIFLFYSKFTLTSLLKNSRDKRLTFSNFEKCAMVTLACLICSNDVFYRYFSDTSTARQASTVEKRLEEEDSKLASESQQQSKVAGDTLRPSNMTRGESVTSIGSVSGSSEPSGGGEMGRTISPVSLYRAASLDHSSGVEENTALPPPPPIAVGCVNPAIPATEGDDIPIEMRCGHDEECWSGIYRVFFYVDFFDPNKQLLVNLRDLRQIMTGNVLDAGLGYVRIALSERNGCTRVAKRIDDSKMRIILKALMQIGANLSQSKEYRDLFEDILEKVHEPLREAGLDIEDCRRLLICSNEMVKALPSTSASVRGGGQGNRSKRRDWARFLLCCRMILLELGET